LPESEVKVSVLTDQSAESSDTCEVTKNEKKENSKDTHDQPASEEKEECSDSVKKEKEIAKKEQPRTVQITNAITKEMITYSHWSGSYEPEFVLQVNNNTIAMGETKTITLSQNSLFIQYDANFSYGYSSSDTITTELENPTSQIVVNFDWKNSPRVNVEQK
jgi:hypothetical protein